MSSVTQIEEQQHWIKRNFASVVRACMAAIITWTIFQIDPLGLGSASGAEAKRAFQRIVTAPFYNGAQNDITVVLIDDKYLRSIDRGWPLPYAYQGRLLETVLSHHPQSVFMDLLYRQRHSADDTPDKLLAPIRPTNTPILLAALARIPSSNQLSTNCVSSDAWSSDDAIDKDSIDSNLFNLRTGAPAAGFENVSVAYLNWFGCGDRYPLFLAGNVDLKTPAFALYAQGQKGHKDFKVEDYAEPMVVMWGAVQSEESANLHAREANCKAVDPGIGARIKLAWNQAGRTVAGIASSGQRGIRLPCLYTNVMTASQLMQGLADKSPDKNPIDKLLRDKYVLIGASVSGIWDLVESPVNGPVPGVFYHAMALDNLLHYGRGYTREANKWWELVLFLTIALLLVAIHFYVKTYRENKAKNRAGQATPEIQSNPKKRWVILELAIWFGVAVVLSYTGHAWAAVLCVIAGLGLDWMRERTAGPALGAGALCLAFYLFIWKVSDWAPFSWLALSAMIIAVRKHLEKLDKQSQQTERKAFSVWHALAKLYQTSTHKREHGT